MDQQLIKWSLVEFCDFLVFVISYFKFVVNVLNCWLRVDYLFLSCIVYYYYCVYIQFVVSRGIFVFVENYKLYILVRFSRFGFNEQEYRLELDKL